MTGFELYMDDGLGGAITTQDLTLSSNDPSINVHTIDLSGTGTVGNIYNFKLRAINNAGYIDSSALSVALASIPSQPTSAPTADVLGTN